MADSIFRTRKNKETGAEEQTKAKVWQRIPCGGKLVLPLTEGVIPRQEPDKNYPEVRVQGSVRAKNANGDRLVTLFLVIADVAARTVFAPRELPIGIVTAAVGAPLLLVLIRRLRASGPS